MNVQNITTINPFIKSRLLSLKNLDFIVIIISDGHHFIPNLHFKIITIKQQGLFFYRVCGMGPYHTFSISRIFRRSFGVIFSLILPVSTTEINPDSSDSTTISASECSDIPIAAL